MPTNKQVFFIQLYCFFHKIFSMSYSQISVPIFYNSWAEFVIQVCNFSSLWEILNDLAKISEALHARWRAQEAQEGEVGTHIYLKFVHDHRQRSLWNEGSQILKNEMNLKLWGLPNAGLCIRNTIHKEVTAMLHLII